MSGSLNNGIRNIENPFYAGNALKDVSLGFSQTTPEAILYDVASINSMIENILTTTPGERPFEPEFGSELPYLIHEPCDEITAWKIETAIYDALKRWMPYITVLLGPTKAIANNDANTFDVIISYKINIANVSGVFRARFTQQ